jgi:RHS repeat-associated protein
MHDFSNFLGNKMHLAHSRLKALLIWLTCVKWSGTHQDRNLAWWKNMLEPTVYLYDGANSIEEVDNSSNILARYAQGLTIDQPLAEFRGSTTDYYEVDALGSVTSLSNGAGTIANTYAYDSFGNVTNFTGSLSNPFRYTGREFDSETSLYFNRARYYDQNAGRFVSEDPSEFFGGQNFYGYVGNDPINLTDPLGLTDCVVTATAVVCTNRGAGLNWMTPQEPQAPQLPSELTPNPPPPPPPPPCKCDMVEYGNEIDRMVWKNVKHEIFFWEPIFGAGEGASEFFAWKFGKRVIPVVKWIKVTKEVYDTYEEVEKIREKYKHCPW